MCGELLNRWSLPTALTVGGQEVPIRADFRQVLQVLVTLEDEGLPLFARWRKALRLFYEQPVAPEDRQEAMEQLCGFISCYQPTQPGPRLLSWSHDAHLIASQINQVAGFEVRQAPFLHWWTFMGYFHAIGPGAFSQVVAIREKLRTGKPLDDSEQRFYSCNPQMIRLPDTEQVKQEKMQLEKLLRGGKDGATA